MRIILEDIIRNKKREVRRKKRADRNFLESIRKPRVGNLGLIAEIKLVSPIMGVLGREEETVAKAFMYERGGADAISVVTDQKYFGGNIDLVRKIKKAVSLPILMKDFILDPFQVYEAKISGADALLFIAKILAKRKLKELVSLALELGIEPVVEIQNEEELRSVLRLDSIECIAINARNLADFRIDIDEACRLIRLVSYEKTALGFSGVFGREEARKYKKAGVKAILVGTSLMRSEKPERFIKTLKNV